MSKVKGFIKLFDFYGSNFNLRINNQSKFKSVLGGFLSLITIGILVFCIVIFGNDFYARQNPKVIIEEGIYQNNIPIINGTQYEEKNFIFSYHKDYQKLIRPYAIVYQNQTSMKIYLEECDTNFLKNKSLITQDSLEDKEYLYYCLKINEFELGSENQAINGLPQYSPIKISWESCKLLQSKELKEKGYTFCDENFNATLDNMGFLFHYEKIGFSPNMPQPFTKKFDSNFYFFSTTTYNTLYLTLTTYSLKDDIGWIISNQVDTLELNFSQEKLITSNEVIKRNYPRATLILSLGDSYRIYYRTYLKFQDMLASIGGFMKLIFSVLSISNFFIRTYLIDVYIISKEFNCDESYLNLNISSNYNSENHFPTIQKRFHNNFIGGELKEKKCDIKLNNKQTDLDKYSNTLPSTVNSITGKINFFSYMITVIFNILGKKLNPKNEYHMKLEKLRKMVLFADKIRDFNFISNKINELDSLKSMFLNEHQSLCLSYLQKPSEVLINESPNRFSLVVNTEEKNIQIISDYFISLLKDEPLNGHDEFLFHRLDEKIKQYIVKKLAEDR